MSASPDQLTGRQAAEAVGTSSNFSSNSSGSSNCSSSSLGSVGSAAAMPSSLETSGAALFAQQLPLETAVGGWQPEDLQTQQQQQQQQYFYTGPPCEYPTIQLGDKSLLHQQQLQFPPAQQPQQQQPAKPQKPKRKRVASQAQRKAANVRERRRMFNLNEAFDTLRTKVPTFAFEKRLSRIETLRLAITYIRFMGQVVSGVPPDQVRLRQQQQQQQQQPMQFQALQHPAPLTLQQPQLQQYPWHSASVPSTSSTVWDPSQSSAEI